MNDSRDNSQDVRADGGLFTGPLLFGGIKLAYTIGKDAIGWFKTEEKLFVQLLDSSFSAKTKKHTVRAVFANAYVHGLHLEGMKFSGRGRPEIVASTRSKATMGWNSLEEEKFKTKDEISYPYLLLPSSFVELDLIFDEVTNKKVIKDGGLELKCAYASVDSLGKAGAAVRKVRLRWA